MQTRRMGLGMVAVAAASYALPANGEVVFSDDFSRADGTTIGNGWTEGTNIAPGFAASSADAYIASEVLTLDADVDVVTPQSHGHLYVTRSNGDFGSSFTDVLSDNPGLVTWSWEQSLTRGDPSGLITINWGIAFILAGDAANPADGNGYAVVLGGAGSPDPLRLVRYSGGVDGSLTEIAVGGGYNALGYPNQANVSITYDPTTNLWSLYDGDALLDAGTDDNLTATALGNTALLFAHRNGDEVATFDNIVVDVVPEPASLALLGLGGLAMLGRKRTA